MTSSRVVLTGRRIGLRPFPASGLHLVSWNGHFPFAPEMWIWRVFSIGVGVAPMSMYTNFVIWWDIALPTSGAQIHDPLYGLVHLLVTDRFSVAQPSYRTISRSHDITLSDTLVYVIKWLNVQCYSAFNILLSVVAFLCLLSLPDRSHETDSWGNYWLHV